MFIHFRTHTGYAANANLHRGGTEHAVSYILQEEDRWYSSSDINKPKMFYLDSDPFCYHKEGAFLLNSV